MPPSPPCQTPPGSFAEDTDTSRVEWYDALDDACKLEAIIGGYTPRHAVRSTDDKPIIISVGMIHHSEPFVAASPASEQRSFLYSILCAADPLFSLQKCTPVDADTQAACCGICDALYNTWHRKNTVMC